MEEPNNNEKKLEEPVKQTKKLLNLPKNKILKNFWMFTTLILGVVLIVSLLGGNSGSNMMDITGNAIKYIGEDLLGGESDINLLETEEVSGVYKMRLDIESQEIITYVTKDGKLFFPSAFDTSISLAPTPDTQGVPAEIPKTNKPKVELFVMSHCPYGTQIEKGIIPIIELLGDKADIKIKFCDYAMHGETELSEQLVQTCIQEESPDKYLDYLKCFLGEGDSAECIQKAGVNEIKLRECTTEIDNEFKVSENFLDKNTWMGDYPTFNVYKEDVDKYGVRGSPTLVINGVEITTARDSANLLNAICSSFTDQPEECGEELSSETPSPGFGFETSGSASDGGCGA